VQQGTTDPRPEQLPVPGSDRAAAAAQRARARVAEARAAAAARAALAGSDSNSGSDGGEDDEVVVSGRDQSAKGRVQAQGQCRETAAPPSARAGAAAAGAAKARATAARAALSREDSDDGCDSGCEASQGIMGVKAQGLREEAAPTAPAKAAAARQKARAAAAAARAALDKGSDEDSSEGMELAGSACKGGKVCLWAINYGNIRKEQLRGQCKLHCVTLLTSPCVLHSSPPHVWAPRSQYWDALD